MSWTSFSLPLASFTLASMCMASGCADKNETGNLSVNYTLGSGVGCDIFDIETVRVIIGNDEESESAACNPDQPIELDGVKAGSHSIKVEAIDSEGFVVMDNLAPPTTDNKVEVLGGSSTEIDVGLSATPAVIKFRWVISIDHFPQSCNVVAPAFFQVTAFENMGSAALLGPYEFECELPLPSYNAVPDPDRDINGSDLDAVAVRIEDADHTELDTVRSEFDPPGPGRVLNFDIVCDGTMDAPECTISSDIPPPSTSGGETGAPSDTSADGGSTGG